MNYINISLKIKYKGSFNLEKRLQHEKKHLTIISIGYSIKHIKYKKSFKYVNVGI